MEASDAVQLYDAPLSELASKADSARRCGVGDSLEICAIVNARSGSCSEDCAFCAQSVHHDADIEEHSLMDVDNILEAARRASKDGSERFGIVTSGRCLDDGEVSQVARAAESIRDELDMGVCASLGGLDSDQFATLHDAGVTRYNHNIETAPGHFEEVVTSHSVEQRIKTVKCAAEAGLSVCCGGILGMGETRLQRCEMADTLSDMPIDSVPVNVLLPLPGTALEDGKPPAAAEVLKTIAIWRLMMPEKNIKLAAGREEVLGDFQGMAFMGGANGLIMGDYLTQPGRSPECDRELVEEVRHAWKN